jgi:glycosyltransferase involved in cell wall biosynthesis
MLPFINKNSTNKILFFCPISPPIMGQSLVSEIVYNAIQPRYLINTNAVNKYFDTFLIISKSFFIILFCKIDMVYFTCTRSKSGAIKDIILLLLCKLRKIKVINHLHGNDLMELFKGGIMSTIVHWSYKQIDTTIFLTEQQKQFMPASLKKMKRVVIVNCYDSILENIERDYSKEKVKTGILYISNIMKSKGIFIALDVFELIAEEYKNVIFHIAGKPMSDYLMSQSEVKALFDKKFQQLKNKFPERFINHGVVEGNYKKNLFLDNEIFLFPTFHRSEAFPLVNVEAMRTGNVVITTNHNFLPDVISENEGRLVEPNDVKSTYEAVKYFLDNPSIRIEIQKHNIEYAKKMYSPEIFVDKMRRCLNQTENS